MCVHIELVVLSHAHHAPSIPTTTSIPTTQTHSQGGLGKGDAKDDKGRSEATHALFKLRRLHDVRETPQGLQQVTANDVDCMTPSVLNALQAVEAFAAFKFRDKPFSENAFTNMIEEEIKQRGLGKNKLRELVGAVQAHVPLLQEHMGMPPMEEHVGVPLPGQE